MDNWTNTPSSSKYLGLVTLSRSIILYNPRREGKEYCASSAWSALSAHFSVTLRIIMTDWCWAWDAMCSRCRIGSGLLIRTRTIVHTAMPDQGYACTTVWEQWTTGPRMESVGGDPQTTVGSRINEPRAGSDSWLWFVRLGNIPLAPRIPFGSDVMLAAGRTSVLVQSTTRTGESSLKCPQNSKGQG